MIKAVVFDVDGTIVDSVDLHAEAWQEAFKKFGKEVDLQALRRQIGKGADQLLPVFFSKRELDEFGAILDKYRGALFKKQYMPRVVAFPKVRELFERIRAEGKKIALASSGKDAEVQHYEKLVGLDGMVDAMATSDQVAHSKPSADVFLAALNVLSLSPGEAIAVGDTPYDVEAAKKIDLPIIGVLSGGFSEEILRDEGAVAIFRDPADLLEHYYQSPLAG